MLHLYLLLGLAVVHGEPSPALRRSADESKVENIMQSEHVNRIIGGRDAPSDRYPYAHVSLQLGSQPGHQCGGSVIAPDMILTAAHCHPYYDEVHIGRYNFANQAEDFDIIEIREKSRHPDFEAASFRHDFAIIHLAESVSPEIIPVRLNTSPRTPADDQELKILGWGATAISSTNTREYPDVLQQAIVSTISNQECRDFKVNGRQLYKDEIFPEMMCAYEHGVDACLGDSGSPLVMERATAGLDVQIGIVSWGRGCAVYPGVYSRVADGYDWIREQVCSLSSDPPASFACNLGAINPVTKPEASDPIVVPTQAAAGDRDDLNDRIEETHQEDQNSIGEDGIKHGLMTVTIQIQADGKSEEIGWYLQSADGNRLYNAPPGSYRQANNLFVEERRLRSGQEYVFTLIDWGGDGFAGWYSIEAKNGSEQVVRIRGNGDFQTIKTTKFYLPPIGLDSGEILDTEARPAVNLESAAENARAAWMSTIILFAGAVVGTLIL